MLLLAWVAGCASIDGQLNPEFSATYSKDSLHNIPSALEATAEQFFLPAPAPAPRTGADRASASTTGGGLVNIDKDTLSSGGDTAYSEQASSKLQLRAGLERPLGDNMALVGGISLSRGASRYFLPQGAGVLKDPITIRFDTTGLEVDAGLAVFTGRRIESRVDFGIGGTLTGTRTRINSALLDVTNNSTYLGGFVYTGIQLALRPTRPNQPELQLKARIKYYPDAGVSIRSGLAVAF